MPLRTLALLSCATLAATALLAYLGGRALGVAFVFVCAFAIAIYNFARIARLVLVGEPEEIEPRPAERVEGLLYYVFREKKLLEEPAAGLMHLFFLYGFLILSVGHLELVLRAVTSPWVSGGVGFHLLEGRGGFATGVYHAFLLSQDLAAAIVIPVSLLALVRRWIGVPERLKPRSQDAENILWFIVVLYLTFFVLNGAEVALGDTWGWFRPFSYLAAKLLYGIGDQVHGRAATSLLFGEVSRSAVETWLRVGFWSHLLVFLAFLNYLPYSKHMHLVAAFPNIYLRPFGPLCQPKPMDFEDESQLEFGTSRVEQFSFKTLLDTFACTECARCNAVCPAHLTGKPLKPKKVLHDIKLNLYRNAEVLLPWRSAWRRAKASGSADLPEAPRERPLPLVAKEAVPEERMAPDGTYPIEGQIHVDEVWSCTTCAACAEVCPVLIQSVPNSLVEVRRHLVLTEADFPHELTQAFKGMEVQGNPWGVSPDQREEWCEGLDVPLMRDLDEPVDYLLWVGCAGATDDRAQKVQRALVDVLRAGGVSFAILGREERCTGDAARRAGNEYLYVQLVEENRETLARYRDKFRRVVTACPHCYNALARDYRQFGVELEVVHHTELIWDLLDRRRIKLRRYDDPLRLTFHDPCYLGRYNGLYEPPRQALEKLGCELVEMERARARSFCCGAGGARMWLEEKLGRRVNVDRTQQALATGAREVCVACPFCLTMLTDGTKTLDAEDELRVRDLAELVAERLER